MRITNRDEVPLEIAELGVVKLEVEKPKEAKIEIEVLEKKQLLEVATDTKVSEAEVMRGKQLEEVVTRAKILERR